MEKSNSENKFNEQLGDKLNDGSITISVIGIISFVLFLISATSLIFLAIMSKTGAQNVANLSALAGVRTAQIGGEVCETASKVAELNNAIIQKCNISGNNVLVEVKLKKGVAFSAIAKAGETELDCFPK